ncbi:HesB/YadR/YfhF family protein [Bacillus sp. BRMEA1]|uniref:HesB/YadR/YfhF family protein n=1 Tax=Neobacillus endophyticus TaxID=2738405 RepID=UPI00156479BF|nr:HesB/YadR/YfhF family protein [Neobacillus endophyticus]NRD79474.1 HesB/YadR/YfhF family protein [Neobacillus endophyticus]
MKIVISDQAQKWFKEEFGLKQGDKMKFYVQLYGSSPIQKGYSLGFSKDEPINTYIGTENDGILFFVEESDLWFFDGHDLLVNYDEKKDELVYQYVKSE